MNRLSGKTPTAESALEWATFIMSKALESDDYKLYRADNEVVFTVYGAARVRVVIRFRVTFLNVHVYLPRDWAALDRDTAES